MVESMDPLLRAQVEARRQLPPPEQRAAIRKRAGVSLEDVAREVGTTRQSVKNWEDGLYEPSGDFLFLYVEVLMELDALMA